MPALTTFILFAIATIMAIPTGIASANQLDIQTPNVQMSLDSVNGVNIRTNDIRINNGSPNYPNRLRRYQNRQRVRVFQPRNCWGNSSRRIKRVGDSTVYTSSQTRVCR